MGDPEQKPLRAKRSNNKKKVPLQPKLCDRLSRLAIQAISGHWKDVQEAINFKVSRKFIARDKFNPVFS